MVMSECLPHRPECILVPNQYVSDLLLTNEDLLLVILNSKALLHLLLDHVNRLREFIHSFELKRSDPLLEAIHVLLL